MEEQKQQLQKSHQSFDNSCVLFVCNKWDIVKEREQREKGTEEKLWNETLEKLQKYFPGFEKENVFKFSVTEVKLVDVFRLFPICVIKHLHLFRITLHSVLAMANIVSKLVYRGDLFININFLHPCWCSNNKYSCWNNKCKIFFSTLEITIFLTVIKHNNNL